MRKGYHNGLLTTDGNLGINLGADNCAEHEWGIKGLHSYFGIDPSKLGVARRKITKVPEHLLWVKIGAIEGIYLSSWSYHQPPSKESDLPGFGKFDGLTTGWGESSFCALSSKPDEIKHLRKLFDAFQNKDIAIWLGGGGVFQNAGLCFAVASRLPKKVTDGWLAADEERAKLAADFKATGIEDLLEKAGKRYFALSPRRDPKEEAGLSFWLNPMDQHIHNYGSFNLSQLRQWAENKGPIMMTAKQRKENRRR